MNSPLNIAAIAGVFIATGLIGYLWLHVSRTTRDFFVASRTVRPWWNASAISGEYLSAGTFLGLSGLVLLAGTQAFWFPIGYTAGYLLLLLFVAAPMRRSGAYTIPDFFEARLESKAVRLLTSVIAVIIGWLYVVPQLHGAALAIGVVTDLPKWLGPTLVATMVGGVVAAGGMRTITYVQAFHYWLKVTALSVPVVCGLILICGHPPQVDPATVFPASKGPAGQDGYGSASLMLGLLLGTIGLPHILVRFYTNPDGQAARRTTGLVIVLIGAFYIISSTMGLLARIVAPDLAQREVADAVVLVLPSRLFPDPAGSVLTALVVAGAFAAFLATSSGLVVSLAGVLSQGLFGGSIRAFRVAALLSALVPLAVTFATSQDSLAGSVGLVFVFAASSLSPALILGIWWRGLTAAGAIAGMVSGAAGCAAAFVVDSFQLASDPLLAQLAARPAAWTVPLAAAATLLGSYLTRHRRPAHADSYLLKLHLPEAID